MEAGNCSDWQLSVDDASGTAIQPLGYSVAVWETANSARNIYCVDAIADRVMLHGKQRRAEGDQLRTFF